MDEKVAERFTAPGDEIERLMFGYSLFCASPTGSRTPSAATGTVMRPDTLRRYTGTPASRRRRPADRARGVPVLPPGSVAAAAGAVVGSLVHAATTGAGRRAIATCSPAFARRSSCSGVTLLRAAGVGSGTSARRDAEPLAAATAPALQPSGSPVAARELARRPAARRRSPPRSSSSGPATSAAVRPTHDEETAALARGAAGDRVHARRQRL